MLPPRGLSPGLRIGMSTKQTNPGRNGSHERQTRNDRRRSTSGRQRLADAKPVRGQRVRDDRGAAALRLVQLQRLSRSRRRRNRSAADGRRLAVRQRPRQHLRLDRRRAPERNARVARQDAAIPGLADRHLRPGAAGRPRDRCAARPARGAHAGRRRSDVALRQMACSAAALLLPLAACRVSYSALDTASPEATRITNLHWLVFCVTGGVSIVLIAALAIALISRRTGQTPAGEWLRTVAVAAAAVFSILVLLGLLTASVLAGRAVATPAGPGALRIQIVG